MNKGSRSVRHPNFLQKPYSISTGFTLIELMLVIAIIGIMASLALPEYSNWIQQEKIKNAVKLTDTLKTHIDQYYQKTAQFPTDNLTAGLPAANKLLSPEVSSVEVKNGAFHIALSEATHKSLEGKVVSVRPVYVAGSPKSPISWICGNAKVPKGMKAAGKNKTNVPYTFLPLQCRDLTGATAKKQAKDSETSQSKQGTESNTKDQSEQSNQTATSANNHANTNINTHANPNATPRSNQENTNDEPSENVSIEHSAQASDTHEVK